MEHINELKLYLFSAAGMLGSLLAKSLGGWDAPLNALVTFMAVDYITGWMIAAVFHKSRKTENGSLNSHIGFKGLCKKAFMLAVVLLCNHMDIVMGVDYIRNAAIIGFLANELLSIVENAGIMGVPLPVVVTKAIELLQHKEEGSKEK